MAQPQWSTPERRTRLVQLVTANKGRCLKGHALCQDVEHYVHTFSKTEVTSHPINAADVREGRAVIAHPAHGLGIVDLAQAVLPSVWAGVGIGQAPRSVGPVVGPKRVAVQHEELADQYGLVEERVIGDWQQEDRDARSSERRLAQQHAPTGEVGRFGVMHTFGRRGAYDPIDVENHVQNRPKYYLQGYGVDGQLRRYAKARIPGTNIVLHVDVSQSIQELSQRKRKWLRRNGIEAKAATALIEDAVSQWWKS